MTIAALRKTIEKLRELDKESDPAPWGYDPEGDYLLNHDDIMGEHEDEVIAQLTLPVGSKNVDFIVALRNQSPQLLRLLLAAMQVLADNCCVKCCKECEWISNRRKREEL